MDSLFIFFFVLVILFIWLLKIVAMQKETILNLKLTIEDLNKDNNGLCRDNLDLMDKLLEAGI